MKKTIAILINTFIRDKEMYECVLSCLMNIPQGRIYLTDNGKSTPQKESFYNYLKENGHCVVQPEEYNYPWRQSFNDKLLLLQDEEFVLKMDDDMFFLKDRFDIKILLDYLDAFPMIGLLGAEIWHQHHNHCAWYRFNIRRTGHREYRWDWVEDVSGLFCCDVIPDFWIARREVFDYMKMNGDLKVGEAGHEDFFMRIWSLRHKNQFPYLVAYTNDTTVEHAKSFPSQEYKKERTKNPVRTKELWGVINKPDRPYQPAGRAAA